MIISRTVRNSEKTQGKIRLRAICDSHSCTKQFKSDNANRGVEKNVSKNAVTCPDCKSALFWTKFDYKTTPKKQKQPKVDQL